MVENNFEQFGFNETTMSVIKKLNFKKPTTIQQKVIPKVMAGESVVGQSQTGSGKTHAFLLPLFNQIQAEKREIQCVITAPTRELATQLYDEVKKVITFANKDHEWTSKLLVGGSDRQKMSQKLRQPPHIIVGTPGRILDLVLNNAISIYSAHTFVVDEADLMLDLGFITEVDQLLIRAKSDIQLLAFSATIPERLEHFFKKYLKNPQYVKINDQRLPKTIEHQLIAIKHRDTAKLIYDLSQTFHPYLAIIFTNGKEQANDLAKALQGYGLAVGIIHGGLSPRERKRALKHIQELRFQYVVATDLASRGIDIKGVSHIINAKLPKEEDFYIHRVGRTGRAGLEGMAISFYDEEDIQLIERLQKRGIHFQYKEIKNGDVVPAKAWNKRTQRKHNRDHIEQEAWKRVKRPKKVKPGYKRKMKQQQEKIKQDMLRNTKSRKKR